MKKIIFAICDREKRYVEQLAEHLHKKQGIPFEIFAFTDGTAFWEFAEKTEVSFLMIASKMVEEEKLRNFKGCITILSEGEVTSGLLDYPVVSKYQSCDQIYGEMVEAYSEYVKERGTAEKPAHLLKQETELFAVYSPVRRCGKTGFALTMGQVLAERRPTLYLNLEPISGFSMRMRKEYSADLSDLIYFFRQNRSDFFYQFGRIVKKIRNLDYIPPGIGWDLARMQTEEWIQIIEEIFQYSAYEIIVVDLDENIGELPRFLSFCKRVYMPILEDVIAQEKIIQYEEMIEKYGNEELFEKTTKVKLPFCDEGDPERLLFGTMGEFVRKILG